MHIRKNKSTNILVCCASKQSSWEVSITSRYYFFKLHRGGYWAKLTAAAQLTNEREASKGPFQSCQLKTIVTDSNKLELNEAEVVIKWEVVLFFYNSKFFKTISKQLYYRTWNLKLPEPNDRGSDDGGTIISPSSPIASGKTRVR